MRASVYAPALTFAVLFAAQAMTPAAADNITIPAAGAVPAITGYLARPKVPGPAPAVVVLHGCEGFGNLERVTADDLASHGFVALAIDTLKPQGVSNVCGNSFAAVPAGAEYATAALAWLNSQPFVTPNHLGVMGFSFGGIETLALVDPLAGGPPPPGLKAAVAYYPGCKNRSPNVSVPLQILDGDADDWMAYAPCQALAQAATAAGHTVQITTYPGATHAFNQPSNGPRHYLGHTFIYDPRATADADAKTMAFFAEYLR
jgi:dienelactone hydrolase